MSERDFKRNCASLYLLWSSVDVGSLLKEVWGVGCKPNRHFGDVDTHYNSMLSEIA
jgi:hypothetical protein